MRKLEVLDRARQADDAQDDSGPANETAAGTTEAVVAAVWNRLFGARGTSTAMPISSISAAIR